MLALVIALTLSQVEAPPPLPPAESPTEERRRAPAPFVPPNVPQRALLSGAAGVAGAGAALGIALAFSLGNPGLDAKFSTAALGALLVTGGAFTVHQTLGGRGEITLALLAAIVGMAAGALIANALDQTVPKAPILTAVIGAVPAAALAVLGLEGTTPLPRQPLRVSLLPSGVVVLF
jgi:uncharacterized membrane protein HdeD (DUF308 family)